MMMMLLFGKAVESNVVPDSDVGSGLVVDDKDGEGLDVEEGALGEEDDVVAERLSL